MAGHLRFKKAWFLWFISPLIPSLGKVVISIRYHKMVKLKVPFGME